MQRAAFRRATSACSAGQPRTPPWPNTFYAASYFLDDMLRLDDAAVPFDIAISCEISPGKSPTMPAAGTIFGRGAPAPIRVVAVVTMTFTCVAPQDRLILLIYFYYYVRSRFHFITMPSAPASVWIR